MPKTLTLALCAVPVFLQGGFAAQQPVAPATTSASITSNEQDIVGFSGKVLLVPGQLAPTRLTVFDRGKSAASARPIRVDVKPDGSFASAFSLPRPFSIHNYSCVKVDLRLGIGDKAQPISLTSAGIGSSSTMFDFHLGNLGFDYFAQQAFTGDQKSLSGGIGASFGGGAFSANLSSNKLAGGVVMACPADTPQGTGGHE